MLNEQNELGAMLNRHVELDAVRSLLRALLSHMARASAAPPGMGVLHVSRVLVWHRICGDL